LISVAGVPSGIRINKQLIRVGANIKEWGLGLGWGWGWAGGGQGAIFLGWRGPGGDFFGPGRKGKGKRGKGKGERGKGKGESGFFW
jgi:hypothetical protein